MLGQPVDRFVDLMPNGGLFDIRPRAFNNKGLVDEYRRPKQAYDVVKVLYRALSAS